MSMDYFYGGQGHGDVADVLLANDFDTNALRPYSDSRGRGTYITQPVYNKKTRKVEPTPVLVGNAPATLPRDAWVQIDETVIRAARDRLQFVADLNAAGLSYNVPNGFGKTILETAKTNDAGFATMSMDPVREGMADRPEIDIVHLPLPVAHGDFFFNARQLAASRNGNLPLDTTMIEMESRRVAELIEKNALGLNPTYMYGGAYMYGALNYPNRLGYDIVNPAAGGWEPVDTFNDFLAMLDAAAQRKMYGPWNIYLGKSWSLYLERDYSAAYTGESLRTRLMKIEGIRKIATHDYLSGFRVLAVQMVASTIRMVNAMGITTVQWDTHGGLRKHWKIMGIQVPQVRDDWDENCGIIDGAIAGQPGGEEE